MRWLGIGLTLVAGLLGVLIHWHVSLFATTNVYEKGYHKPTPLVAGHLTMTDKRCKGIKLGFAESTVYRLYGGDHSGDWGSDAAGTYTGSNNDEWFYAISHSESCLVFFNGDNRVNEVAEWVQVH